MKKSYSLSTLMLLMIIVALSLTLVVTRWKFVEVHDELEVNRQRFGHIRVDDESKTYVSRITNPNESVGTSYRIRVPEGSRYLLHLSDMVSDESGFPVNPEPTKSISLNGWRDGADVILTYSLYWENDAPRFRVHTESQSFFNYVPPDWSGQGRNEATQLETSPQVEYSTDETVNFVWWRDPVTDRGLLLWLEPYDEWHRKWLIKSGKKNRDQKENDTSDQPSE